MGELTLIIGETSNPFSLKMKIFICIKRGRLNTGIRTAMHWATLFPVAETPVDLIPRSCTWHSLVLDLPSTAGRQQSLLLQSQMPQIHTLAMYSQGWVSHREVSFIAYLSSLVLNSLSVKPCMVDFLLDQPNSEYNATTAVAVISPSPQTPISPWSSK